MSNQLIEIHFPNFRLASMGYHIGERLLNLIFIRDKQFKRETRLINILIFIKNSVWKTLFGKEADKLEQANDDEATCKVGFFKFKIVLIELFSVNGLSVKNNAQSYRY